MALAGLVLCLGCARPPAPAAQGNKAQTVHPEEDSLQSAVELLRSAQGVAGYRDSLRLVDMHLRRPEEGAKLGLAPDDR